MKNNRQKKHITRDRMTGLILTFLSIIGFFYVLWADWGNGPGLGAKLFPKISYLIILIMGISLIIERGEGEEPEGTVALVSIKSTMIFIGLGTLYFLIVLKIGLIVATAIYSIGIFTLLSINPIKQWRQIIIASGVVTVIVWILFSRFITLVLPTPILF